MPGLLDNPILQTGMGLLSAGAPTLTPGGGMDRAMKQTLLMSRMGSSGQKPMTPLQFEQLKKLQREEREEARRRAKMQEAVSGVREGFPNMFGNAPDAVVENIASDPSALRNLYLPDNASPSSTMKNLMSMNLEPGSPEWNAAMSAYMQKTAGTNVNVSMDKWGAKPIPTGELGKMRMPDGSIPPVGMTYGEARDTGVQVFEKMGETERKQALFAKRMEDASSEIEAVLEGEGVSEIALAPTVIQELSEDTVASPFLKNEVKQQYDAARKSWTLAFLRLDTGAQAPPHEEAQIRRTYFPAAGDVQATIELKRRMRATAMEAVTTGEDPRLRINKDLRELESMEAAGPAAAAPAPAADDAAVQSVLQKYGPGAAATAPAPAPRRGLLDPGNSMGVGDALRHLPGLLMDPFQ